MNASEHDAEVAILLAEPTTTEVISDLREENDHLKHQLSGLRSKAARAASFGRRRLMAQAGLSMALYGVASMLADAWLCPHFLVVLLGVNIAAHAARLGGPHVPHYEADND